jgi:hypothetical protein
VTEDYIRLGLRLGRHVDGLVDGYFGPSELEDEVKAEPLREPAELARDAAEMLAEAEDRWLRAQLVGLETVAQKLAGAEIAYADEVERCYGVRPERVPESEIGRWHEELDRVLPAGGSLAERYRVWREGNPVPRDQLAQVLETVAADLRRRTRELVGLPEDEEAELEFVKDEPWLAHNYYLGGLRSRVAVNLDLPIRGRDCGARVRGGRRRPGRARRGVARAVRDRYDAVVGAAARSVNRLFDRVGTNTALLLYEDGASEEEARSYLQRWALLSDELAAHSMRFLRDPIWHAYVPTYAEGYRVCSSWVGGDTARFRRLLTEPLTPAELAA